MGKKKEEVLKEEEVLQEVVAPEGTKWTIESEDGKKAFLKEPTKSTYGKVLTLLSPSTGGEPNILEAGEVMLRECMIGGDIEFRTEVDYVVPAAMQAMSLFEMRGMTLKKN